MPRPGPSQDAGQDAAALPPRRDVGVEIPPPRREGRHPGVILSRLSGPASGGNGRESARTRQHQPPPDGGVPTPTAVRDTTAPDVFPIRPVAVRQADPKALAESGQRARKARTQKGAAKSTGTNLGWHSIGAEELKRGPNLGRPIHVPSPCPRRRTRRLCQWQSRNAPPSCVANYPDST